MLYPVFKEINYLTYDELKALNVKLAKLDQEAPLLRKKRKGDALVANKMYVSAIKVYQQLLKKEGLDKLMSAVFKVYDRWNVRIPTAPLNKWFEDIKDNCPPPLGKNKRRIKLRYITQAKTRPPSFYMFSSNPEGLPDSYLRYLTNSLRETFNLGGIPIRLNVRKTGNPYADKKERRNPLRKMAKPKE